MAVQPSLLWHDYETTGADPRRARPTQFACLRTDLDLQPLGDPEAVWATPVPDLWPDPESCLITGQLPDQLAAIGVSEPEFADFVLTRMARPGTCNLGYNNFRFDDEITRHLCWRQLRDPYAHEWAQGNSRFDLIDVLRMAYALRPQGLEWPRREDGQPSFRLEHLAAANGVAQAHAHDARDDVLALVGLARRLRAAQPRLWVHAFGLRDKAQVGALLNPAAPQVLVHVSQRFAAQRGCLALVLPLVRHPTQSGRVLVADLQMDPQQWMHLPPEVLAERWFARADSGVERPPLKTIALNRAPMLAPLSVLQGVDLPRIALDPQRCLDHAARLQATTGVAERITEAIRLLEAARAFGPADVEQQLYDGFLPAADKRLCEMLLRSDPLRIQLSAWAFTDARLHTLLWRRQARWYPASLDTAQRGRWDIEARARLLGAEGAFGLADFDARMAELRVARPEQHALLDRLQQWRDQRVAEWGLAVSA